MQCTLDKIHKKQELLAPTKGKKERNEALKIIQNVKNRNEAQSNTRNKVHNNAWD